MLRSKTNLAVVVGMLLLVFTLMQFTMNGRPGSQSSVSAAEKENADNNPKIGIKIFRLEHADAPTLSNTVMPLFEGFAADRTVIVFDQRTNKIIARGPESELKVLEAVVTVLDEERKPRTGS